MLPVLKKADWRRVRKKREVRRSVRVSDRKGDDESAVGTTGLPLVCLVVVVTAGLLNVYTRCSRRTQVIRVTLKPR